MPVRELLNLDEARRFVHQGLWMQRRLIPPSASHVRAILEWSLEIASAGAPLPPIGFVADIGLEVFDMARGEQRTPQQGATFGLAPTLARAYEDQVLGKIDTDSAFERAKDALKKYDPGKDRVRGLAFLVSSLQQRAQLPGVILPPSIIRTMIDASADETLRRGHESLRGDGLMPLLEESYRAMVDAARRTAEWLTEADIRALENRIALAAEGQRLAHELVIRAKRELQETLPQFKLQPLDKLHDVPTRVLDEDTYPVGGFNSISTRGGVESLLQSQLAFMEKEDRPDLFDIKFLRNELYYYSRDENQFLRRRRRFVFAMYPDLAQARVKEPDQNYQRIVYLLGLILAAVEALTNWLGDDALHFDFVFLHDEDSFPLNLEYELLELLFMEQIANGTVTLYPSREFLPAAPSAVLAEPAPPKSENAPARMHTEEQLAALCEEFARRNLCNLVTLSLDDHPLVIEEVAVSRFILNAPQPSAIMPGSDVPSPLSWPEALQLLLRRWV
jgi:hypothetical protein